MIVFDFEMEFFEEFGVIYFVGIGGLGMSGIVCLFFEVGYCVIGFDLWDMDVVVEFCDFGVEIVIGYDVVYVVDVDMFVVIGVFW